MKSALKWIAIGFFGLIVIVAIAGGGGDTDSSETKTVTVAQKDTSVAPTTKTDSPKAITKAPAEPAPRADCGTRATDDCTPHVPADGHVRVDALTWRIESARATKTLGDQQYGLGAKASGRFIVLKLRVHSYRDESATLTDNVVQLEVDGNTYDADNDGTVAAIGAGEEPFFLDTIGPDANRVGTVVFDVPTTVLAKKIEVRFGELGFGATKGYIRLPRLSAA